MPNEHALLSASSASRWMACTAAPRFEAQFPETTSEYAEEGRLAHALCELKVLKKFTTSLNARTYNKEIKRLKAQPIYSDEMDKTSELYLEHLNENAMTYDSPPLVNAEVKVDFSEYVPGGFGTCDCVMIGGDTLIITDYKHGKGVPVSAEGNAQMRLYALGVLRKEKPSIQEAAYFYPFIGESIKNVRMTIDQRYVDIVTRIREACEVDARKKFELGVIPSQLSGLWMSKYGYTTKTDSNITGAVPIVITGGDELED
ncbi:hypothetical protein FACS1894202_11660 [Clostridia bacterium]|nr:hypothetical protein FACS1894202_11660 [Clostridia bacterium]